MPIRIIQGKKMNLSEINWDINAAGNWPTPIKIVAILIISVIVAMAGVYLVTMPQLDELDRSKMEETNLKLHLKISKKKRSTGGLSCSTGANRGFAG